MASILPHTTLQGHAMTRREGAHPTTATGRATSLAHDDDDDDDRRRRQQLPGDYDDDGGGVWLDAEPSQRPAAPSAQRLDPYGHHRHVTQSRHGSVVLPKEQGGGGFAEVFHPTHHGHHGHYHHHTAANRSGYSASSLPGTTADRHQQ